MRSLKTALMSAFLCVVLCSFAPASEETPEELKNLYAGSAVLMDGDSGRILYGKNAEEVLPMASTTKIMTCILALELSDREEICLVTDTAAAQPKVHLGMRTGETYYLGDLLYSMMLESHNDSAVCVAEHVGGSVEGFANLMNQKAKELGCEQTHFVTPNGLDGTDDQGAHSTTAADLARILRYCIGISEKKEEFLNITQTLSYSFCDVSGNRSFTCTNHNALLGMVDGVLSGKTGYTGAAGYCYVGAVCQDGKTLIGALLACGWPNNKGYKWSDMRRLLDYGFSHYEKKSIDLAAVELPRVAVLHGISDSVAVEMERKDEAGTKLPGEKSGGGAEAVLSVLVGADEKLTAHIRLPETVEAPVTAGSRAGSIEILAGKDKLEEYFLSYREGTGRFTWSWCLEQVMQRFFFFG
ncbi:MAG: D-alanyl-D-alanine carboxypeptidase family protein [Lachnospiraceae bacterium]|nr:D-alanyl-D-alanine carboxypeptidase family protein [Lachnospiraceae bacterium]